MGVLSSLFIGKYYSNNSQFHVFKINKLECNKPATNNDDKTPITFCVNYLYAYSDKYKIYGNIILDKDDILQIGIDNIKIDSPIFVDANI